MLWYSILTFGQFGEKERRKKNWIHKYVLHNLASKENFSQFKNHIPLGSSSCEEEREKRRKEKKEEGKNAE